MRMPSDKSVVEKSCFSCLSCCCIKGCGCHQIAQIIRGLNSGADGVRFVWGWGIGVNYFFFGKIHIPYHAYMKNNGYFCSL